jgi:uroporphyrinogen-III synthase
LVPADKSDGSVERVGDSLFGARVALLEARRESELAALVRRHGGEAICVPALREVELECEADAACAIDAAGRSSAVVVLATGVGLERWMAVADKLGRLGELRECLERATVVCRGPKPVAVLKREGLPALLRAPPPHTTRELLELLAGVDVEGRDVVFVHDGGSSRVVSDALAAREARVCDLKPYGWAMPEDTGPLEELVMAMVGGNVDALAITTQIQAQHLFQIAARMGQVPLLREALRNRVIVAAVGPTCAEALERLGAPAHVVPEHGKMGSLVLALAAHQSAMRRAAPSAV